MNDPVHMVMALRAEAQPFIERWRLERVDTHGPFRRFRGPQVELILSGVGKLNAAAACGYLASATGPHPHRAWVNLGIAGHPTLDLGSIRCADLVVDRASDARWIPKMLVTPPCPMAPVHTVDSVDRTYIDEDAVVDMEACGFFTACQRFVAPGLVQVIKVISDNRHSSVNAITPAKTIRLVRKCLNELEEVIAVFRQTASDIRKKGASENVSS